MTDPAGVITDFVLGSADPEGLRALRPADKNRIHRLRIAMADEKLSAAYINQVTNSLLKAIDGISGAWAIDPASFRALWYAMDHLGDEAWKMVNDVYQCNIFVYDCYLRGADVPMPDRKGWVPGTQPYGANALANRDLILDHLEIVDSREPGYIFAFHSNTGRGHSALIVSSNLLIYAGEYIIKVGTVDKNMPGHDAIVIRRP